MAATLSPDLTNIKKVARSESLASHVSAQIESMITQGQIGVGEKLPTEKALGDMFGVSRTVVREAISQLKSLGLVETRRGVGTTVIRHQSSDTFYAYEINPSAVEDILHILELRLMFEPKAAELAALRRSDEDITQLHHSLTEFDQALDNNQLARKEDFRFHMLIAQATHNPLIRQFYEQFNKNIIPRAQIVQTNINEEKKSQYLERVREEHHNIMIAIQTGNSDAAGHAMHQHLFRALHMYQKYQEKKTF